MYMPKTSIDLPAKRYFQTLVFNIGIVSKVPGKSLASDAMLTNSNEYDSSNPLPKTTTEPQTKHQTKLQTEPQPNLNQTSTNLN